MNFIGLLSKMLTLFLFVCIGFLCSKIKIIDEHGGKIINKLVLCICAPAMMINSVLGTELQYSMSDILMLLVYAVIFNTLTLVVGCIFARIFCKNRNSRGAFQLAAAFGNIAFMGFPVVSALYGNSAVFLASICTIPFNLFLYSIGTFLAVGGTKKDLPWKKVFLSPVMIATVIAVIFFFARVSLPAPLVDGIGYLANMVVPLSMILIGSSLGR